MTELLRSGQFSPALHSGALNWSCYSTLDQLRSIDDVTIHNVDPHDDQHTFLVVEVGLRVQLVRFDCSHPYTDEAQKNPFRLSLSPTPEIRPSLSEHESQRHSADT